MKQETIKRILSSIILIPIALFFIIKGSFYFAFFLIAIFLIASQEWFKMSKKKMYSYLGTAFLFFSFYSAFLLRGDNDSDLVRFFFVIIICVATDIGGYVFGKIFRGPKLIKISPNKTYAGMIGSYFLAIIFGYYYFFSDFIFLFDFNKFEILDNINFRDQQKLFIIIFLISSVSQTGDLIISYFKRVKKIKNTGKILPGHGGFLDRVDGIIFAIPFAYLLFKSNLFIF